MADYAIVLTTAGSKEEAHRLAHGLVEGKFAACVQLLPVDSVYFWDGAIQSDAEILMLIKTRRSCFAAIETFIGANHSYETPELVCVDVTAGAGRYFDWIDANTRPECLLPTDCE